MGRVKEIEKTDTGRTFELKATSGEINLEGDARLTGVFAGRLNIKGTLTIGPDSKAVGEINAGNIIVFGQLAGLIKADSSAIFHSSSSFSGCLISSLVAFHPDCKVSGTTKIFRDLTQETF